MTLPRYLEPTQEALIAIIARATAIAKVLPDLHSLAYDKPVNRDSPIGGGRDGSEYDTLGVDVKGEQSRRVKRSLADLERSVLKISKEMETHYAKCFNNFAGPSSNDRLRGTTLGNDKGHGAATELKKLTNDQQRRKQRGEYTPHASEEQPEVPTR